MQILKETGGVIEVHGLNKGNIVLGNWVFYGPNN